jgi:hypothetical protein
MHSSSPSRGRWILAIGAVIMAGSCFLQWWQIGGNGPNELSQVSANGFNQMTGSVYLMFLAAIASLFLVTLPFASEKPVGIDHPLSYLVPGASSKCTRSGRAVSTRLTAAGVHRSRQPATLARPCAVRRGCLYS